MFWRERKEARLLPSSNTVTLEKIEGQQPYFIYEVPLSPTM